MTAFATIDRAAAKPVAPRADQHPAIVAAILLLAFAFALRMGGFGSPVAGLDEQFYLLVGDRMLGGALPYVDIWDRKPAGLFLIYAAIRLLPGDGILAYQIVATFSIAATSMVIGTIARRFMPPIAALVAGCIYICGCTALGAGFGEAPVFYNLPVSIAAWCILALRDRPIADHVDRRAAIAMLLCGVALTIKTSAVFEGCAFGLLLLHADARAGLAISALARRALAFMLLGLAPTAAIAAFYAAIGAFDIFWFANVQSIFLKSGGTNPESIVALVAAALALSPLIAIAALEARGTPAPERTVLLTWAAATMLGFGAIGFFHFHYALPMLSPMAILAARTARHRLAAGIALSGAVLLAAAGIASPSGTERDRADITALVAALPAEVRTKCLFVYEGPTILYHLSNACLPGRYVFPGHFTAPDESDALERPTSVILRETLLTQPAAIVTVPDMREGGAPTANDRILAGELARNYRPVARREVRLYGNRRVHAVVWVHRHDSVSG